MSGGVARGAGRSKAEVKEVEEGAEDGVERLLC